MYYVFGGKIFDSRHKHLPAAEVRACAMERDGISAEIVHESGLRVGSDWANVLERQKQRLEQVRRAEEGLAMVETYHDALKRFENTSLELANAYAGDRASLANSDRTVSAAVAEIKVAYQALKEAKSRVKVVAAG